jgi:hypothetical protein
VGLYIHSPTRLHGLYTENFRRSTSRDMTYLLLQNPKIHYRVHSSQPLSPIRSYMNPVCTITSVCKIRFNSTLQRRHLEIRLSLTVPIKSCMNFSSLPCVLHIPPFSFSLDIITLPISVEQHESRSSSLCRFSSCFQLLSAIPIGFILLFNALFSYINTHRKNK